MRRSGWAIFSLCAGVFLLTLGRGFYTSDGEVMFLTTAALAERGSFALAADDGLPQIVQGADGRWYGKYDPGLPLLAVPFFVAGERIAAVNAAHRWGTAALAVLMLSALAAAGAAAGVTRLAESLGGRRAARIGLAAGLATPLWVYGRTLFAEAVLACALTWSAALLARGGERGDRRQALLAGLVFGAGIAVRAALAVYALPLIALILWRGESRRATVQAVGGFTAGALPGIGLVLWHNALRFGDPLVSGYGGEGFTARPWVGVVGLLISPERGVLLYAPPLVMSAALWWRWRHTGPAACALADMLALAWAAALAFYGSWWAWHGGWAWGPRLLVPLVPLSLLPWLALPKGRGWRLAAAGLIALGAVINGAGALVDVTPHLAESTGALTGAPGACAALYAPGEVFGGRTEPLALFHLGDLGLPLAWRIGLPALAAALIAWGVRRIL